MDKSIKDKKYEGYIISGLDEKNKGRYKVYIPELMQKEESSKGLLCRNNIHRYNLTTSEIGNFGSWLPLKTGTKVLIEFKDEDYSAGYIVSTIFEEQDDAMNLLVGLKKEERDELYLLLKTAKNNCRLLFTEELQEGIKNSFQLRHNKGPKREYNLIDNLSKDDPLEEETLPYESLSEEETEEKSEPTSLDEEIPNVEEEISDLEEIPDYLVDIPIEEFLPEFDIALEDIENLPQDIIDDVLNNFDLELFEIYSEDMIGFLSDEGISILSDLDILNLISSNMRFGLLEDGSFIDIRRLSQEILDQVDIFEFDISNLDTFEFDLLNIDTGLSIGEEDLSDFFLNLKYYTPEDLLHSIPTPVSKLQIVTLNTIEPILNNNNNNNGYVYVPKYDLYLKPDGTNLVDDVVFNKILQSFTLLYGFIEYEGGYIPHQYKSDINHSGFPVIDSLPAKNDSVCKILNFDHPSGRGTKPCPNFYNRIKYLTFTRDNLSTVKQEILKNI